MANVKRFLFLLLMLVPLAACREQPVAADQVWGRVSPAGVSTGAFYMQLTNNQEVDDVLLAVRTGACDAVELHESRADENDVMRMGPVAEEQILLPAGETVTLQPGGLHVMCIGLTRPFTTGSFIPITLVFEHAEALDVEAGIRMEAP